MLEKICVGFDWEQEPQSTQEYLYEMFKEVKYGISCPKTGRRMEEAYPSMTNFKLFKDKGKMERYTMGSKKLTENYASHLLDGEKFFLVWNYKLNKEP